MSLRPDRDAVRDRIPGIPNRPGIPHGARILGLLDDPELIERLRAARPSGLPDQPSPYAAQVIRAAPPPTERRDFWQRLRRAWEPDPRTRYGAVLPLAEDLDTGEVRLAAPRFVRDFGLGLVDLVNGVNTGVVTPEATMALLGLVAGPATRTPAPPSVVLRSGPIVAPEAAAGVARAPAGANARGVPGARAAMPRSAPGGGEAARRPGIGHNNPPSGPMPGEEGAATATAHAHAPGLSIPRTGEAPLPIPLPAAQTDAAPAPPSIAPSGDPVPAFPASEPPTGRGGETTRYARAPEPGQHAVPPDVPHAPTPEEEAAAAAILDPRRMNTDQEGRPVTARYRSGRLEDGSDLAMPPQEIAAVARLLAGRGVRFWSADRFRPGVTGVTHLTDETLLGQGARTIANTQIRIRAGEPVGGETFAHEVGHGIHYLLPGGRPDFPVQARSELHRLYRDHIPGSPESLVYDDELFANAASAYLRNPRWINEQSPAAAAYLRSVVNEDPVLRRILGLNSTVPAGLLGAGAATDLLDSASQPDAER